MNADAVGMSSMPAAYAAVIAAMPIEMPSVKRTRSALPMPGRRAISGTANTKAAAPRMLSGPNRT